MSAVADGELGQQEDRAEAEKEAERRACCRDLARLGETKCKTGDVVGGIGDLEEALAVGTSDLKLKSIICSQLGNAYIDLKDYKKAVEKHQEDRALSSIVGDAAGEAKACCNLACAFRLQSRYKEAINCSEQCVQLCRRIRDKEKESLAMYSLATCYHSMAKRSHLSDESEGDKNRNSAATNIVKAVQHYLYFLKLLDDISKPPSYNTLRGRTYGNLGNLYYLLNNMDESVAYHQKRLEIAVMDGDVEAIVRAHSNIGNAHLVGGNPSEAEKHYKEMQGSAEKISDGVSVAKALFGLATSHSIRKNYPKALSFYSKMQKLVKEQQDEDGQLKVLFGMTYANRALGRFEEARTFAMQHYQLASQMGDEASMELAQGNIDALSELLQQQSGTRRHSSDVKRSPSSRGMQRVNTSGEKESYIKTLQKIPSSKTSKVAAPPPILRTPPSSVRSRVRVARSVPEGLSLSVVPQMLFVQPTESSMNICNSSTDSSRELFKAVEQGSRGRMNEQRAEAPEVLVGSRTQRHNTIGAADDLRSLKRNEKPKGLSLSFRRDRIDKDMDVASQASLSHPNSRAHTPPESSAEHLRASSSLSTSTGLKRSVLMGLGDQVATGDSSEQIGLSDFLTFLDGQE
ncbi:G-protein-signaling modulator 2-like isoform X2 [Sycon ciliatum]|uniref:G-protein-signaling modulator 2-like isoform X2 n=1 Tax=Sycon ciliatum TaxID=27933 RepID=UPI0031F640AA